MHPAKIYTFFCFLWKHLAFGAIFDFFGGETSAISHFKVKTKVLVGWGLHPSVTCGDTSSDRGGKYPPGYL